jgi:phosphoadenosine phosphosulfate reductase
MPVWKAGGFVADDWRVVADDAPLADGGQAVVSLKRWRSDRAALAARTAPLGLAIAPGETWTDVAADLARFPLIVVTIPKYADGRAFSVARLLRERDGYAGEIRAAGVYIIDQVPLMMRVGIDAFETADPALIRAFATGVWPEVEHYLQPAIARRDEIPAGTRPWVRKKAPG